MTYDDEKPREACGVFGIYDHPDAAKLSYFGLYALQHRGQESAGIAVARDQSITTHKGMGLVSDVFNLDQLEQLRRDGRTVLFSSHSMHYAAQTADRVAILVDGRIAKIEDVSLFQNTITNQMKVSVHLTHTSEKIFTAVQEAGADITNRNGKQVYFRAAPGRRLDVFRAIEGAGGVIEEFHTETPDWDSIIRPHLDSEEERK